MNSESSEWWNKAEKDLFENKKLPKILNEASEEIKKLVKRKNMNFEIELSEIEDLLQAGWGNDIESQKTYMQKLCMLKARINELKNIAEDWNIQEIEEFLKMKPSQLKQYEYNDLKQQACKESLLFKLRIDRISSSITHSIDGLKSVLYHSGQELKNLCF